jgi:hypothetical protein
MEQAIPKRVLEQLGEWRCVGSKLEPTIFLYDYNKDRGSITV